MSIVKNSIKTLTTAVMLAAGFTAYAASPVDETYTTLPLSETKTEGTLIFSDCPEYADKTAFTPRFSR